MKLESKTLSNNQVFRICIFWSRIGPPIDECIDMLFNTGLTKEETLRLIDNRLFLYSGVLEKQDVVTAQKLRYHIKKFGIPEDLDFNKTDLSYLTHDGLTVREIENK